MYIEDPLFLNQCKALLLKQRENTLNHLQECNEVLKLETKDDSAGEAKSLQDQNYYLTRGHSLSLKLKQIDEALHNLENGEYGYCKETEEPIEKDRLLALPWTSLSLTGAELLEKRSKKLRS